MKIRLIASAAFIALFGGSAIAADLAVKAPPPPPAPIWSWTGWYVGLNVGGIWSNSDGVTHSAVAGPCNTSFAGCTAVPNYSTLLAMVRDSMGVSGITAGSLGAVNSATIGSLEMVWRVSRLTSRGRTRIEA